MAKPRRDDQICVNCVYHNGSESGYPICKKLAPLHIVTEGADKGYGKWPIVDPDALGCGDWSDRFGE